jgi:hypothetical protein
MSQAGIINVAGGGGGGAPIQTLTGNDGIAVPPTANNIFVLGGTSTVNNTNGITTIGNAGTSTETFTLTNRASVSSITSDGAGQTQTVLLITPTDTTSISFRCLITGYDVLGNTSIGGEQIGLARKSGGTVVVVGTNDTFDESDASLNTADWNVISTSPTLSIQFVGVAGRTINWRALFEYTQAP